MDQNFTKNVSWQALDMINCLCLGVFRKGTLEILLERVDKSFILPLLHIGIHVSPVFRRVELKIAKILKIGGADNYFLKLKASTHPGICKYSFICSLSTQAQFVPADIFGEKIWYQELLDNNSLLYDEDYCLNFPGTP